MKVEYVRELCNGCEKWYAAHPDSRKAFCKKCINKVVNSYMAPSWSIIKGKVYHPCIYCDQPTVSTKWQVIATMGYCRACDRHFYKRQKEKIEQRK